MTHVTFIVWPLLGQAHAEREGSDAALHGAADAAASGHGAAHGADPHAADAHSADPHHGEAAHGDDHGAEHHDEGMAHLPTVTTRVAESMKAGGNKQAYTTIMAYENFFYATLWMGLLIAFLATTTRKMKLIPETRAQLFVEFLIQGLRDFVHGNLGEQAKPFVVFIGSLFLFIWINNYSGQVPMMKPVTADFRTTIALGLCVFVVVQLQGIRQLGLGGWLGHLAGMPDAPAWMAPINFPLHVIGELVKPVSLALRLFGNIFGEEMLVTAFIGLGAAFFLPFHFPFYFLGLLVGFVQAMVFTLLTCAYIGSMSHHHEEHHEGEHHHDAHGAGHVHGLPGVPEGAVTSH